MYIDTFNMSKYVCVWIRVRLISSVSQPRHNDYLNIQFIQNRDI